MCIFSILVHSSAHPEDKGLSKDDFTALLSALSFKLITTASSIIVCKAPEITHFMTVVNQPKIAIKIQFVSIIAAIVFSSLTGVLVCSLSKQQQLGLFSEYSPSGDLPNLLNRNLFYMNTLAVIVCVQELVMKFLLLGYSDLSYLVRCTSSISCGLGIVLLLTTLYGLRWGMEGMLASLVVTQLLLLFCFIGRWFYMCGRRLRDLNDEAKENNQPPPDSKDDSIIDVGGSDKTHSRAKQNKVLPTVLANEVIP